MSRTRRHNSESVQPSAVVAVLGAIAVLPVPAAASAATLRVSTSGSDGNPCTAAAPCASLQRAYAMASNGGVVEVTGGTYGGQNFNAAHKPAGPNIVFRPGRGSR